MSMQRRYVGTRLGQLHVTAAGPSTGTPIVLLPKAGRSGRMFSALSAQLSDDHAVYAIDYPGTGRSDRLPRGTSFEALAAACVDAFDELNLPRTSIYGLYTGNKIATAIAANSPTRVAKLVLAGQSHSLVPDNRRRAATVGQHRRSLVECDDPSRAVLQLWADVFARMSRVWWSTATLQMLDNDAIRGDAIAHAADELLATDGVLDLYRANFTYDLQRDLERILAPTLIIEIATPSEDRLIGRQGQQLCALVRGSSLVTLEEPDGHGNTLDHRAVEIAEILRAFLRP